MNGIWWFVISALILQESATMDAALVLAAQAHLDLWLIHGIWVAATAFDIWLGWEIGKRLHGIIRTSRMGPFVERWTARIRGFMGARGEKVVLVLLGLVNFPWANAFLASWLDVDYRSAFIFIFIGDALWYALEWGIVAGLGSLGRNPHAAIIIVVAGALILGAIAKVVIDKVVRKNKKPSDTV